jgi:hypothetical protein
MTIRVRYELANGEFAIATSTQLLGGAAARLGR